ncbi:hypothetical protein HUJ05_001466 [Dendroctonus ponderosae]|nr:hypothetical protein HUJ05_001466 [Dendroctonus ponderosae]
MLSYIRGNRGLEKEALQLAGGKSSHGRFCKAFAGFLLESLSVRSLGLEERLRFDETLPALGCSRLHNHWYVQVCSKPSTFECQTRFRRPPEHEYPHQPHWLWILQFCIQIEPASIQFHRALPAPRLDRRAHIPWFWGMPATTVFGSCSNSWKLFQALDFVVSRFLRAGGEDAKNYSVLVKFQNSHNAKLNKQQKLNIDVTGKAQLTKDDNLAPIWQTHLNSASHKWYKTANPSQSFENLPIFRIGKNRPILPNERKNQVCTGSADWRKAADSKNKTETIRAKWFLLSCIAVVDERARAWLCEQQQVAPPLFLWQKSNFFRGKIPAPSKTYQLLSQ